MMCGTFAEISCVVCPMTVKEVTCVHPEINDLRQTTLCMVQTRYVMQTPCTHQVRGSTCLEI